MKYLFCKLTFFILFLTTNVFAQTKTTNIEIYSKVWGFMKYHHPTVAGGTINWDSVYIAHINKVMEAKNTVILNNEITEMINATGPVKAIDPVKIPDDVFTDNHDLKWLNTPVLTLQNRKKLLLIYNNRNQGNNVFIKPGYDKVAYSGEKQYQSMVFPNQNYRLLFLARFWNIINYFDPYKYAIGEDWDNVLVKFIPKIVNANNTQTYYKILLQLAVSLHDGHAQLELPGSETPINELVFGKYTAPVYVTIINDTVIVRKTANDSLCAQANIKAGDLILSVNNIPVIKKIAQDKPYVSASNSAAQNEYLSRVLLNTIDVSQKLKIKRGRKVFTAIVKNIPMSEKKWVDINNYTANQTGYKIIGNSIVYVYAMQVWKGNMDTIKSLIKTHKAVIFDGRNYQNNGDIFYSLFDIFLPAPKIINWSTGVMPANPGYFEWKPSGKIGRVNNAVYSGKVVLLVDERAQSQGEYTAMALQTIPNAVTVGSTTAGADGVKTYIPMGGKLTLSYSGYGVYYPDKTPTQRIGVKIDISVKKTVKAVVKNEDEILDKALNYLKSKGVD